MGPWLWGMALSLVAIVVSVSSGMLTESEQRREDVWAQTIVDSMIIYQKALECFGNFDPAFMGAPTDTAMVTAGCLPSGFQRPLEGGVGVKGELAMTSGAVYYDGSHKGVMEALLVKTHRSPMVGAKTSGNILKSQVDLVDTTMNVPATVPSNVPTYVYKRTGAEVTITFSSDKVNVDLLQEYKNLYGDPDATTRVKFVLPANVAVTSASAALPAMTTNVWPGGAGVKLDVKGVIVGKGGDGANPCVPHDDPTCLASTAGGNGGPGLELKYPVTLIFTSPGVIGGGGGGGGGPDSMNISKLRYHYSWFVNRPYSPRPPQLFFGGGGGAGRGNTSMTGTAQYSSYVPVADPTYALYTLHVPTGSGYEAACNVVGNTAATANKLATDPTCNTLWKKYIPTAPVPSRVAVADSARAMDSPMGTDSYYSGLYRLEYSVDGVPVAGDLNNIVARVTPFGTLQRPDATGRKATVMSYWIRYIDSGGAIVMATAALIGSMTTASTRDASGGNNSMAIGGAGASIPATPQGRAGPAVVGGAFAGLAARGYGAWSSSAWGYFGEIIP